MLGAWACRRQISVDQPMLWLVGRRQQQQQHSTAPAQPQWGRMVCHRTVITPVSCAQAVGACKQHRPVPQPLRTACAVSHSQHSTATVMHTFSSRASTLQAQHLQACSMQAHSAAAVVRARFVAPVAEPTASCWDAWQLTLCTISPAALN